MRVSERERGREREKERELQDLYLQISPYIPILNSAKYVNDVNAIWKSNTSIRSSIIRSIPNLDYWTDDTNKREQMLVVQHQWGDILVSIATKRRYMRDIDSKL